MKKLFVSIIALAALSGAAFAANNENSDSGRYLASVTNSSTFFVKKAPVAVKNAKIAVVDTLDVMHSDIAGFGVFSQGQARN